MVEKGLDYVECLVICSNDVKCNVICCRCLNNLFQPEMVYQSVNNEAIKITANDKSAT